MARPAPALQMTPRIDIHARAIGPWADAAPAVRPAERLGPMLRRLVHRLGLSETEIEDSMQETLLRVWRAAPGFRGRSSVSTWACRIAINQALATIRSRHRPPLPEPAAPVSPETCVEARRQAEIVRRAVLSLPGGEPGRGLHPPGPRGRRARRRGGLPGVDGPLPHVGRTAADRRPARRRPTDLPAIQSMVGAAASEAAPLAAAGPDGGEGRRAASLLDQVGGEARRADRDRAGRAGAPGAPAADPSAAGPGHRHDGSGGRPERRPRPSSDAGSPGPTR
jgi:hypothetical protein